MRHSTMTPEQEIERIKKDYQEHWHWLEKRPGIMLALATNDPVKLGEIAAMMVYGGSYEHSASARHKVLVFVKDSEKPVGFDDLISAKVFIQNKANTEKIHLVLFNDGTGWGTVSI